MPILLDRRVKKKDDVSRYRVIHNYTDVNGNHKKVERKVWGKAAAQEVLRDLEAEFGNRHTTVSRMTVGDLEHLLSSLSPRGGEGCRGSRQDHSEVSFRN